MFGLLVNNWLSANVSDNEWTSEGDYVAGISLNWHVLARMANNYDLRFSGNRGHWAGNNGSTVGARHAWAIKNNALDTAGGTRSIIADGNVLLSDSPNWNVGLYHQRAASIPVGSTYKSRDNWSNAATPSNQGVYYEGALPT
jgi:hypothetical protein